MTRVRRVEESKSRKTSNIEPLYSVVIPTYNRAGCLPDALRSVFGQEASPIQVIVVDDGSTDDTASAVDAFDREILYLKQERQGPAVARNRGLALAEGRYVSFLDSDDIWLSGKLEAELEVFGKRPETEAVFCDCSRWVEGECVSESWLRRDREYQPPGNAPFPLPDHPPRWIGGKLFATSCLTLRRDAFEKLGAPAFDTSLQTHEDWDLAIRMHHSCDIVAIPRVLAHVRRFNDGTRAGRPLPGLPRPPEWDRLYNQRRYVILDRALDMPSWPPSVAGKIGAARRQLARMLAAGLGGWERRESLPLALKEARRGDWGNAARVLALGLGLSSRRRPEGLS